VRENRTQGSVRGRSGNWPFYLDAAKEQTHEIHHTNSQHIAF
jgi:hypothetical protein